MDWEARRVGIWISTEADRGWSERYPSHARDVGLELCDRSETAQIPVFPRPAHLGPQLRSPANPSCLHTREWHAAVWSNPCSSLHHRPITARLGPTAGLTSNDTSPCSSRVFFCASAPTTPVRCARRRASQRRPHHCSPFDDTHPLRLAGYSVCSGLLVGHCGLREVLQSARMECSLSLSTPDDQRLLLASNSDRTTPRRAGTAPHLSRSLPAPTCLP